MDNDIGTIRGVWAEVRNQEGVVNRLSYLYEHSGEAIKEILVAPFLVHHYVYRVATDHPKAFFTAMVLLGAAVELVMLYHPPSGETSTLPGLYLHAWNNRPNFFHLWQNTVDSATGGPLVPGGLFSHLSSSFPVLKDWEAQIFGVTVE